MKLADNSIKTLKSFFHSELGEFYDENEINNFFYWLFYQENKWSRADVQLNLNERLSESELLIFFKYLKRLKNFEPIQYILGEVEFAGCKISVNSEVLIPRPETEELVFKIIERVNKNKMNRIIDLCSGSGCIALGLKKNLNQSEVSGIDVSITALDVAIANAKKNNLEISFTENDLLTFIPNENEKYDIIVSNPPYILNSEKMAMFPNVLNFEPHLALFVEDDDPLIFYKQIINNWSMNLSENGFFAFEINERYATEVVNLFDVRLFHVELVEDMQGKPRMVFAKKI